MSEQPNAVPTSGDRPRRGGRAWRLAVPVVCLGAGVLLATTHTVSGGAEIRRSDAPRLVDLVREAGTSVDQLTTERDGLSTAIQNHHGGTPAVERALRAIDARAEVLGVDAGLAPMRGPGLVVTLTDAARDAQGRFPRDAAPDDLVVHQQDVEAVLNALWSAGAEAIQMQDQRLVATSAPMCVGNTLLLGGRTYGPPYVITAIGDAAAMQSALAAAPLVTLYRQYVVRFGLGYTEQVETRVEVVGRAGGQRLRFARPAAPLGY